LLSASQRLTSDLRSSSASGLRIMNIAQKSAMQLDGSEKKNETSCRHQRRKSG
jgi:hypothetical protein